jgi:hypothetical protein
MGSSYTTFGTVPRPDSAELTPFINRVCDGWLAACPLARTTTYYFSQSGDDTTGNGSSATPWKTLAKAQTTLDAAATYAGVVNFRRCAISGVRCSSRRRSSWPTSGRLRKSFGCGVVRQGCARRGLGGAGFDMAWFIVRCRRR